MRVCVIGAGAAGLTTIKHLLEEGFEVEVFEKRDGLGGLWYFGKNATGVTNSTRATSSKTYLQFSDFPMGHDVPHFPHHTHYIDYLKNYAQTHDILPMIKYNHEVLNVKKTGTTWQIKIRNGEDVYTKMFDAIAICSGLHHVPLMLDEIPGSQDYQGEKFHSSLLKSVEELRGKRVVVIGAGESGGDFAHEVANVAGEAYLSLRRGIVVIPRWWYSTDYTTKSLDIPVEADIPTDCDGTRAKTWMPREFLHDFNNQHYQYSAFKTVFTLLSLPILLVMFPIAPKRSIAIIRSLFDWKMWEALFKPQQRYGPASGIELSKACHELCKEPPKSEAETLQRILRLPEILEWYSGTLHNTQPYTKSPFFLKDVAEGKLKVIPGIKRYNGGKEIEFEDGAKLDVDAVVMCTGFQSILPFLESPKLDGREFYKNVFLPGESTLAFIGFARPNVGAMPPIAEMQARWFARVLSGQVKLPDAQQMKSMAEADALIYNQVRKIHAQRVTSLVDYFRYMNEIAGFVGCRPNVLRLLLKPKMFFAVIFGPLAPFQFRLHGYGANPEAAIESLEQTPFIPFDRVLEHISLYFLVKPLFVLLDKLGLHRFRPVF